MSIFTKYSLRTTEYHITAKNLKIDTTLVVTTYYNTGPGKLAGRTANDLVGRILKTFTGSDKDQDCKVNLSELTVPKTPSSSENGSPDTIARVELAWLGTDV
jgi:hypothetical protein